MKALIVDDDLVLADVLSFTLRRAGFLVITAHDGQAALDTWQAESPDLIVLDLNLPKIDGLTVCQRIREKTSTPIIILSVRGEDDDVVHALELGADDYITKPFSPREVLARVKAIFRRLEKPKAKEVRHEYGGIALDHSKHEVTYKGKSHSLTSKEFKLLEFFLGNKGRVLSRDILLNEIWGYDYFGTTRTVDVHVAHLRHKFQVLNKSLVSIKGLGYKLQDEPIKA